MTKQELLVEKRKLLLTAIIFGVGCIGLLVFFLIAIINSNKDVFVLALDLLFAAGFAAFSYQTFRRFKILNNAL